MITQAKYGKYEKMWKNKEKSENLEIWKMFLLT